MDPRTKRGAGNSPQHLHCAELWSSCIAWLMSDAVLRHVSIQALWSGACTHTPRAPQSYACSGGSWSCAGGWVRRGRRGRAPAWHWLCTAASPGVKPASPPCGRRSPLSYAARSRPLCACPQHPPPIPPSLPISCPIMFSSAPRARLDESPTMFRRCLVALSKLSPRLI